MKALAVGVLTFGVVVGGGYAVSRAVHGVNGSDTARVVRVIDGDTVDVESNGKSQRVRLLNIDTPETKHPDKAVQCLGPEAQSSSGGCYPRATPSASRMTWTGSMDTDGHWPR